MADIVIRDLERVVKVALAIKKAVETAKQNKEDCVKIGERAAEVSTHMKRLKENTKAMEDPLMSDTLKSMEETLQRALKLVNECQRKHVVLHYLNAGGMSKKLRQVQEDISYKLWNGVLATVVDTRIALEKQIQSAIDAPLHQHQQRAGQVETSQSSHSRTDQASEKGKAMLARVKREQSELLSGVPQFSLSQLNAATNEFSEGCVVERGYYKGVLHDGLDVAIKKLSVSDDIQERRLQLELNIRAKLEHGNILKLLGYCLDAQEKEKLYFLVEEYIPNVESLEKFINVSRLDWSSCFKIIQGIAKGLHCLHKHHILYMDLNPANILVRSDMNPVVINFGSSIVLDRDDDKVTGDAVAGTLGYVAPEKLMEAYASMMSDVFSFGIIIIEIITGRRASPFVDLPEWGSVDEMITSAKGLFDPALANESQLMKINRCREVGLKCIERDPKRRPTMGNVLEMLSS